MISNIIQSDLDDNKQKPYQHKTMYDHILIRNNLKKINAFSSKNISVLPKDLVSPKSLVFQYLETLNPELRKINTQTTPKQTLKNLVSATSWIIHDTNNKKTIGLRQHLQKQIASLTKMMTCVIVIQMMKKYCIEKNIILRVSKNAAMMIGTSANLRYGYWIRLIDLLYGLMLPSGNDAACLLAQNFGLLIFYEKLKPKEKKYADIESIDITSYQNTSHFINQFVKEMNKKAKLLGMNSTSFANPHGLPNNLNYSTAKDMLILSRYCRSVPQFMQIASTKFYKCVHYLNQEQNEQQFIEFQWKNTNKLLYQGWEGLKTGQTMNAGACLASFKQGIFIIVLNCGNAQKRFEDTLTLHQWYINQIKRDNHS